MKKKYWHATRELLEAIQKANPALVVEDLASAWFTATADLDAAYPAKAARQMGWTGLAMLCAQEMQVRGSLQVLHTGIIALEYHFTCQCLETCLFTGSTFAASGLGGS